ncbi:MAG: hypothetical protein D3925_02260 [Candidatus Electrothrix sp. AR5]|nr:hypothetical protein [Candidatus Electrothrix sp. AR5]
MNRYAYARNSPVVYVDPSGHIFWDVVDVLSFGHSVYSFAKDPSWANAGWLAADTVGLLPGIPGASTVKMGVKGAGAVVDVAKAVDKASDAATVAKKAENASDVAQISSKAEVLETNKISGKNWENTISNNLPAGYSSADQVTLKVQTSSGSVRIRADQILQNKQGQYFLVEGKASASAGFTKNQSIALPELGKGVQAEVRGVKGLDVGLQNGKMVEFQDVYIVRPNGTTLLR